MSAGLYTDTLLTAVRDYAGAASNEEDAADARLIRLINREQELRLSALLARAKGNYRLATLDYTVTSGTTYAIPTRAIAAGIRQIEAVDASGNVWMLYEYPDDQRSRGWPRNGHWHFSGNNLVFYAVPPAGTLRITYYRRMSELVKVATVGVVTTISVGAVLGTIAVTPPVPVFAAGATNYDFVKATPHFDILAMDKSATYSAGVLTFAPSDVPSGLAVGDHICLAGQTAYCQAPLELHPVLAQLAVVKWLESKADPRLGDARDVLRELEASALTLLEPRTENGDDILFNPNAPGWAARRWNWRGSTGQ